jgi:hypothetical protein
VGGNRSDIKPDACPTDMSTASVGKSEEAFALIKHTHAYLTIDDDETLPLRRSLFVCFRQNN